MCLYIKLITGYLNIFKKKAHEHKFICTLFIDKKQLPERKVGCCTYTHIQSYIVKGMLVNTYIIKLLLFYLNCFFFHYCFI